ncbi:hypothetical protein GQ53DRAFT_723059 [Thozetella sp. PMI_491]|nr:hypothetical protein GQ53DRAFT_723059 [Thozetella sp. PMI_491]
MGFADFSTDDGLADVNGWLTTRLYIASDAASQADVAVFQALNSTPDATKYPEVFRWYKQIAAIEEQFPTLPGDASKPYTAYGPDVSEAIADPAKTSAAADAEDGVNLLDSDDEEDEAAQKLREQRLEEYRKKNQGKTKPAAKSVVIIDIKPWDDTTDLTALETLVRGIEKDGLVWGASKLVPIGFGIQKLHFFGWEVGPSWLGSNSFSTRKQRHVGKGGLARRTDFYELL